MRTRICLRFPPRLKRCWHKFCPQPVDVGLDRQRMTAEAAPAEAVVDGEPYCLTSWLAFTYRDCYLAGAP